MTSTRRWFAATLCILAFASPAFAQLPTGTVLGTVRDASGGVIPGATLTAVNSDTV